MNFLDSDANPLLNQPNLIRYTSDELTNLAIKLSLEEEALRKKEEERKEMEAILAEIENAEKLPAIQNEVSEEIILALAASRITHEAENAKKMSAIQDEVDEEINLALAASRMTHEVESGKLNFNNRTNRILESISPPPPGRFRQCLELQKGMGGLLVGAKFTYTNDIARKTGGNCSIRFLGRDISTKFDGTIGDCLLIEADDQESVEAAEVALVARAAEILARGDRKPPAIQPISPPLSPAPEIRRHIIVDNSNVFISAQSFTPPGSLKGRPDPTIRIRPNVLASIFNPLSKSGLNLVAGSKPPIRGKIWQHWESAGYQVKVCSRDIDTGAEDLVDEFLHAQAMSIVLNRQDDPPGQNTLVLCTGDGNDNHGYSNFVEIARNTARRGWRVEIWSWSHSRSGKYQALCREFPALVTLHDLDPHAERILYR
jgi:class 3 adenylate cyclase